MYEIVFDAAAAGYRDWWILAGVLVFPVIGAGMIRYVRRPRNPPVPVFWRVWAYGWMAFSMTFVIPLYYSSRDYLQFTRRLETGHYDVVEGVVSHFQPAGRSGEESFWVGRRFYEYREYERGPAYRQTRPKGGRIRDGLRVRIADVDGRIARLEMETEAGSEPAFDQVRASPSPQGGESRRPFEARDYIWLGALLINWTVTHRCAARVRGAGVSLPDRRWLFSPARALDVPWVVMGAGMAAGAVPGFGEYFHPLGSWPVRGYYLAALFSYAWLGVWLFRGGARQLARLYGTLHPALQAPWRVWTLYLVVVASFGVASLLLIAGVFPPALFP